MSLFAQDFRSDIQELAKKTKDPSLAKEEGYPICYPTTFLPLDYRNGLRVSYRTIDEQINYSYDAIGMNAGRLSMFVGKNGSGKTALAIQMAASIVQRFRNSVVIHLDPETGTNKMRISNLTGWSARAIEEKYILSSNINTPDSVKTVITRHCRNKLLQAVNNPKESCYFTGLYDIYNKPIYEIIPTVFIIDSIPMLYKGAEEGESSNMTAAISAKAITDLVKTITPLCKKANVLVFAINHIQDNINTNAFIPQQAQNNYLTQSEKIPGKAYFETLLAGLKAI